MNKKIAKFNFILTSVLLVVAIVFCFVQFNLPSSNYYNGLFNSISATGELTNGNNAVYEITTEDVTSEEIDSTVQKIRDILNGQGLVGSKVYRQGNYIRAEVESKSNSSSLLSIIGSSESFYISETNKSNTSSDPMTEEELQEFDLMGKDIKNAYKTSTTNTSTFEQVYGITIEFTDAGKEKLKNLNEKVYARTSDQKIYFYIGGVQSSSLEVQEQSQDYLSFYSTGYTEDVAQEYALQILMASTGVQLKTISNNQSTATLGKNVLLLSMIAVAVILLAVMIVLPILYGDMGLLADLSVLFGGVFTIFLLQALPFTTSSIATIFGALLGMGVLVVCHIVYMNKIKSEFSYLHKLQLAVRTGFKKSWLTNLDICAMVFVGALSLSFWNIPYVSTFAIGLAVTTFVALFNTIVLFKDFVTWYVAINTKNYKRLKFTKGENNEN